TIVSVVTLVWGISPRQPSGKNIIRWLLKKRTNGSVRYCQYTSRLCLLYTNPHPGICGVCQSALGGDSFNPVVSFLPGSDFLNFLFTR
ncbi:hypothetical protein ACK2GA_24075, partial [Escherichia coli]